MTVDQVTTFINSTGFPIVACVGLFFFYNKTLNLVGELRHSIDDLSKKIEQLKGDNNNDD